MSAGSAGQPEPADRQGVEQRRAAQVDVERVGQPVRVVGAGQPGRRLTGRDQRRVQVALLGGGHPPPVRGPLPASRSQPAGPLGLDLDPDGDPVRVGGQLVAGRCRGSGRRRAGCPARRTRAPSSSRACSAAGGVRPGPEDRLRHGRHEPDVTRPGRHRQGMHERRRGALGSATAFGGSVISGYAPAAARRNPAGRHAAGRRGRPRYAPGPVVADRALRRSSPRASRSPKRRSPGRSPTRLRRSPYPGRPAGGRRSRRSPLGRSPYAGHPAGGRRSPGRPWAGRRSRRSPVGRSL